MDEKSYENFLIYNVACKTLFGRKALQIMFDKVDQYIRKYDSINYLALFHSDEKHENFLIEQDTLLC